MGSAELLHYENLTGTALPDTLSIAEDAFAPPGLCPWTTDEVFPEYPMEKVLDDHGAQILLSAHVQSTTDDVPGYLLGTTLPTMQTGPQADAPCNDPQLELCATAEVVPEYPAAIDPCTYV